MESIVVDIIIITFVPREHRGHLEGFLNTDGWVPALELLIQ